MSSLQGVQRSSSARVSSRRSQKPYAARPGDRGKLPKREGSGFLDGLKSIVTGPLSWLAAIGKDTPNSDEENIPGDGSQAAAKRRSSVKARGTSPPRKRFRKEGASQPDQIAGYLDPPDVLRVSSLAPNVPLPLRENGAPRPNVKRLHSDMSEIETVSQHGSLIDGRRPHRPNLFVPSIPTSASSNQTNGLTFPSMDSDVPQSPLRPNGVLFPSKSIVSPNSGLRRTSIGQLNHARRQSRALQFDYAPTTPTGAFGPFGTPIDSEADDQTMRSPLRSSFRALSRSPSAADASMRVHFPSPERVQGHVRTGSLLRGSRSVSPVKPFAGSIFPATRPLERRSSSMMVVDQLGAQPLSRNSSHVVFDPAMGITTTEEVQEAKRAKTPRNNAEQILQALERATPLSDARKLRMKQKQALHIPAIGPSSAASTGGKAGRMTNPYARPMVSMAAPDQEGSIKKTPGSLRRYIEAGKKAKQASASPRPEETTDVIANSHVPAEPTKKPATDRKTSEAVVEDDASTRAAAMPGRSTSSLRAPKTTAQSTRKHNVPIRSTNKFSARFLDDEDDDEDGDSAMATEGAAMNPAELKKWVDKRGGGLEIPAGMSFKFGSLPKPSLPALPAVDEVAKQRDEAIKKLLGDQPRENPFSSLGKPTLPTVASNPFLESAKTPQAMARLHPSNMETGNKPAEAKLANIVPPPANLFVGQSFSFTAPTKAPEPAPATEIAPKTTNGPVPSLPFSFGAPPPAKPAPAAATFTLAPPAPAKADDNATKSLPFSFGSPSKSSFTASGSSTSLFSGFGKPPTPPKEETAPKAPEIKLTLETPVTPAPAERSAAPSPPPSIGFEQKVLGNPMQTPLAEVPPSKPSLPSTFGGFGGASGSTATVPPFNLTSPAPTPSIVVEPVKVDTTATPEPVKPAPTPSVEQAEQRAPVFSFKPASTPVAPAASPSPFSFKPVPLSTTASKTAPKPSPFVFGSANPPSTASPIVSTASAPTPIPTSSFSFSTPLAAPTPAPAPFVFGGAQTTQTTQSASGFNFGAASSSSAFGPSPTKPATPPPAGDSMMDEGSPTRESQPAVQPAAATNGAFPFPATSVQPATPTATSSPFSFSFKPTNAFASTPTANGSTTPNPFSFSGTLSVPQTANPFAQPASAGPFGSQPNSPFQSPLHHGQGLSSPAVSATGFGSPHPAAGGFPSANGAGGAIPAPVFTFGGSQNPTTSPIQSNNGSPAFVLGSSPTAERVIKPPPRRLASGTAKRAGQQRR